MPKVTIDKINQNKTFVLKILRNIPPDKGVRGFDAHDLFFRDILFWG